MTALVPAIWKKITAVSVTLFERHTDHDTGEKSPSVGSAESLSNRRLLAAAANVSLVLHLLRDRCKLGLTILMIFGESS